MFYKKNKKTKTNIHSRILNHIMDQHKLNETICQCSQTIANCKTSWNKKNAQANKINNLTHSVLSWCINLKPRSKICLGWIIDCKTWLDRQFLQHISSVLPYVSLHSSSFLLDTKPSVGLLVPSLFKRAPCSLSSHKNTLLTAFRFTCCSKML